MILVFPIQIPNTFILRMLHGKKATTCCIAQSLHSDIIKKRSIVNIMENINKYMIVRLVDAYIDRDLQKLLPDTTVIFTLEEKITGAFSHYKLAHFLEYSRVSSTYIHHISYEKFLSSSKLSNNEDYEQITFKALNWDDIHE